MFLLLEEIILNILISVYMNTAIGKNFYLHSNEHFFVVLVFAKSKSIRIPIHSSYFKLCILSFVDTRLN